MHRHLVTVKVGVIGMTHQRVQLNGATFHQNRLERLDPVFVERRRPVKQDRMLAGDLLQDRPNLFLTIIYHPLGAFHIMTGTVIHQLAHNKRFKQFQGHLLRQSALMEFEFRPHNNHRTTGIVDPFPQQVLTKSPLFPFEHIAERFQRPVPRPFDRFLSLGVVEQDIDRLLQHPFFIPNDHLRRLENDEPPQPVIAVYNPTVKII